MCSHRFIVAFDGFWLCSTRYVYIWRRVNENYSFIWENCPSVSLPHFYSLKSFSPQPNCQPLSVSFHFWLWEVSRSFSWYFWATIRLALIFRRILYLAESLSSPTLLWLSLYISFCWYACSSTRFSSSVWKILPFLIIALGHCWNNAFVECSLFKSCNAILLKKWPANYEATSL